MNCVSKMVETWMSAHYCTFIRQNYSLVYRLILVSPTSNLTKARSDWRCDIKVEDHNEINAAREMSVKRCIQSNYRCHK